MTIGCSKVGRASSVLRGPRAAFMFLLLAQTVACRGSSTYTGMGDVVAVDAAELRVTIDHDEIPRLMGAMTMTFPVRSADVLAGVGAGTRVRFALVRSGNDLIITQLVPTAAPRGARPGVHDHTPHHGGVVAMVGMRHLEAVATPDGTVRVYVTDVWRRPLPLEDASGSVTLELPAGRRSVPLSLRDDALAASGPPLPGSAVAVGVRVTQGGEPMDAHFMLPLGDAASGAAGVPLEGCVPPSGGPGEGRRLPRCTLTFDQPVTFIASAPDGATAFVAVVSAGVSAWGMPDGRFRLGLAPPPPIVVPREAPPHADAANAVAVSPDGREAVVALENRLVVYSTADGRFVRELPPRRGVVRGVAWSPDGANLLLTVFYDAAAHLVRLDDGRDISRLPVELEAAAVAFAPDGKLAAVGSEVGAIVLFHLASEPRPRVLADTRQPIEALAWAGDRLVSAGGDGVVRVWDVARARVLARGEPAGALRRLALAPGGGLVASAGFEGTIRLHDVASGALLETLAWHGAAVGGLAWAGPVLVSGDGQGRVALWDLSDRLGPQADHRGREVP